MLYKGYFTIHSRYYIVGATLVFHVAALILLVSARLLYRSPEKDEEEEPRERADNDKPQEKENKNTTESTKEKGNEQGK